MQPVQLSGQIYRHPYFGAFNGLATGKMWGALNMDKPEVLETALKDGADPNATDQHDPKHHTPLGYLATRRGDTFVQMVALLKKYGADMNKPGTRDGITPLGMLSSSWGILTDSYVPPFKVLLENGADPNSGSSGNPLSLIFLQAKQAMDRRDAERNGKIRNNVIKVAKMLMAHGAKVNKKNRGAKNLLLKAHLIRDKELVKFLRENGATHDMTGYLKTGLQVGLMCTVMPFVWIANLGIAAWFVLTRQKW